MAGPFRFTELTTGPFPPPSPQPHTPPQSYSVLFQPRRSQIVREQLALHRAGATGAVAGTAESGGGSKSAVVVPEDVEAGNGGKAASVGAVAATGGTA